MDLPWTGTLVLVPDKYDPDERISLDEGVEFEAGLKHLLGADEAEIEDAGEDEDSPA